MNNDVLNRMQAAGPKKILTIDGGELRAMIGIEVLTRLEEELRGMSGQAKLVLADYFDVIAGTQSGSWVATLLAAGQSMAEIKTFLAPNLPLLLDGKIAHNPATGKKIRDTLDTHLAHIMSDSTLGSPALRSLLILVLRNRHTNSPWPLCNNPLAKYNDSTLPDCNLNLPLGALLEVSRKWHDPAYVSGEAISIGGGKVYNFTDGMLTMYGNPSFLAYQLCTTSPYKINFKPGPANLLLVSVGNGRTADTSTNSASERTANHQTASAAIAWDHACRSVGQCRFGAIIDSEFGAHLNLTSPDHALFGYMRYEPDLTRSALDVIGLGSIDLPQLWHNNGQPDRFSSEDAVLAYWQQRNQELSTIGSRWAATIPMREHFIGFA